MIPKECRRLAEADFPIAVVSKHSAREKSIRHGYSSTLRLWWARRPPAACRAMLLALLLLDPRDEHCLARLHHLLTEKTGKSKRDKAARIATARTLWVSAVNNHGGFGRWDFIEIADPWDAMNTFRAGRRKGTEP
jgi:adenine-specific DNA methylase